MTTATKTSITLTPDTVVTIFYRGLTGTDRNTKVAKLTKLMVGADALGGIMYSDISIEPTFEVTGAGFIVKARALLTHITRGTVDLSGYTDQQLHDDIVNSNMAKYQPA